MNRRVIEVDLSDNRPWWKSNVARAFGVWIVGDAVTSTLAYFAGVHVLELVQVHAIVSGVATIAGTIYLVSQARGE